jgi:hypothetical protein
MMMACPVARRRPSACSRPDNSHLQPQLSGLKRARRSTSGWLVVSSDPLRLICSRSLVAKHGQAGSISHHGLRPIAPAGDTAVVAVSPT